jgi:hypothetical protein
MAHAKRAAKRKRRRIALPILGAAGMSLAMAGGTSAVPIANVPSQDNEPLPVFTLDEEEISDVTLATFYVFDKEGLGTSGLVEKVARRCGGCGGARACRGCAARACRGCRGVAVVRGCRGCGGCGGWRACGGCGCGGCGVCWQWTGVGWIRIC